VIITKLSIENLGLFYGRQIFNLRPESSNGDSKSIILIGGKNGVGKTTLFEAVRLCLYGSSLYGNRLRKGYYENYLSERIHHIVGSSLQPSNAAVEVEFEYSHLGKIDTYSVKRSWQRKDSKIIENLKINKNGELLNDIEADQWQDFLNELIPPGVSQLFFFDGEKIQQLAEDDENNLHLKDSFKSLLGLDLVERLQADLGIYAARNSKEIGVDEVESKVAELQDEQKNLEELLDKALQDRAQKQSQYEQILGEIERQELKIASEGGAFASKRNELKLVRAKLDSEIDTVKNHIRELCANLLQFAITPKFCQILKNHLIEEEKYQKWKAVQITLNVKIKELDQKIRSSVLLDDLEIPDSTQQTIITRISEVINNTLISSDNFQNFKPIHQLSPSEQQRILVWTDLSFENVPNQLLKYTRRFEKLTRKRQNVENSLHSAPDDDVLNPLIQILNESNKELGQLQEQIRTKDDEIHQIEFKLLDCSRRLRIELEKSDNRDELSSKLNLAGKVQTILKEYVLQLQKEKIEELGEAFLTCFNRLSRKGNVIQKIEVNVDDFSIVLYDRGGKPIPKQQLSAGEKEIYAISMLWALTQTSGRPLPFIIDTPLGRLDSDHRESLIMDFFPNASHQMIVFSTDTEINKQYFKSLLPFIARNYHLEYSPEEGRTKISNGYFWKNEGVELINELQ
jgi:DNA sulfur modification protein DndD